MKSLIEKFYTEEIKGKCTDNNFEFGNLHRKEFKCAFCSKENECHYNGECERRNASNHHLGWRIS